MAEKRTTVPTDETATAVPRARASDPGPAEALPAAEPNQTAPATRKATKKTTKKVAQKAAKQAAGPAKQTAKAAGSAAKKAAAPPTAEREPAEEAVSDRAAPPQEIVEQSPPAERAAAPAVPAHPPAQPEQWAAAAWDAVRRPDRPPLHLAALAVAELGPRAAAWAQWLRATYPGAPPHGLFRLATRQGAQAGRALALAGIAGTLAGPVSVPAAGWVRATVVLRIAAAYGHDPAAPERAGELLDLLGVGAEPGSDERGEALDQAVKLARRLRFVRFIPIRLRWRRNPLLNVPRLLINASQEADELERLAHRAARYYRGHHGSMSRIDASAESTSSANSP
jgi:hypothetical protein